MLKRVLRTLKVYLLGTLAAGLLGLLNSTFRWKRIGYAADHTFWADTGPKLVLFWHDTQLCMPAVYRLLKKDNPGMRRVFTLISAHADGRLIAWAVSLLGLDSVRGSSTRGGAEGALHLLEEAKKGSHVAITPDGPRGPRHKFKRGAVVLARRSRLPLVPVAVYPERRWEFGSWDRMFLPKPFARVVVNSTGPIMVPEDLPDDQVEAFCDQMAQRLEAVYEEAKHALVA
jgi:lysophospholipid acyltransferase (LPLAT)-like uncharacterized protein